MSPRIHRPHRRRGHQAPAPAVQYIGLITRAIAFALDAAVVNVVATIVGVGFALVIGLLNLPEKTHKPIAAISAVVYVLWNAGYFVGFWSVTGQTPGARAMSFRVVAVHGERLKPRRAVVRLVGLVLAAIPLFAGYLIVPFDPKRRALQDYMARTVVIDAPKLLTPAQQRAAERRAVSHDDVIDAASATGDDTPLALTQSSEVA